jgi:hypothetical protein
MTADWLLEYVWNRDTPNCIYCKKLGQEVDHVLPVKYKGPTIKENLVLACKHCNNIKGGRVSLEHLVRGFYHLLSKGESLEWLEQMWSSSDLNPVLSVLYAKIDFPYINQTKSIVNLLVDNEHIGKEKWRKKYLDKCLNCGTLVQFNFKNLHFCSLNCRQSHWRKHHK